MLYTFILRYEKFLAWVIMNADGLPKSWHNLLGTRRVFQQWLSWAGMRGWCPLVCFLFSHVFLVLVRFQFLIFPLVKLFILPHFLSVFFCFWIFSCLHLFIKTQVPAIKPGVLQFWDFTPVMSSFTVTKRTAHLLNIVFSPFPTDWPKVNK